MKPITRRRCDLPAGQTIPGPPTVDTNANAGSALAGCTIPFYPDIVCKVAASSHAPKRDSTVPAPRLTAVRHQPLLLAQPRRPPGQWCAVGGAILLEA